MTECPSVRVVLTACAVLIATLVPSSPAAAQSAYVSPEIGWSQARRLTVGGRIGVEGPAGLDLVGQALVFFPETDAVGDAGVGVSRSAWEGSVNALYLFDRSRTLSPYLGVGVRYGRSRTAVVVDGLRATVDRSGPDLNLILGVVLVRLPGHPFLEWKREPAGTIATVGVRLALGSR